MQYHDNGVDWNYLPSWEAIGCNGLGETIKLAFFDFKGGVCHNRLISLHLGNWSPNAGRFADFPTLNVKHDAQS